jgi:hypothetical protein
MRYPLPGQLWYQLALLLALLQEQLAAQWGLACRPCPSPRPMQNIVEVLVFSLIDANIKEAQVCSLARRLALFSLPADPGSAWAPDTAEAAAFAGHPAARETGGPWPPWWPALRPRTLT